MSRRLTAAVDERKTQLKALIQQKQTLEAQYTPDHPDVVEINRARLPICRRRLRAARSEPATASAAPAGHHRPDPPQLQQLKAQLRAAQQAMVDAKQEQARIEQQIRTYESRIESSPQVEEEYKQITRDHETALEFYNSLLKKMNESSMATALEQRQQGEQFRGDGCSESSRSANFPEPVDFCGWRACWRPVSGLASCRVCLSIAILPCAMRGIFGPSPSCRLWP